MLLSDFVAIVGFVLLLRSNARRRRRFDCAQSLQVRAVLKVGPSEWSC